MQVGSSLNPSYVRVNDPHESTATAKNPEIEIDKSKETNKEELTSADKSQISNLQARDSAVRTHEAAHIAAGGGIVKGGASFSYQKGPDNKLYAIGGEVSIDTSGGRTPQETIAKMRVVQAAALAPSNPSSTDFKVAATAKMLEMQARLELTRTMSEELSSKDKDKYTNNEEDEETEISVYA